MSESKREAAHTPGPWFVGAQNDALYILDRRPAHDNDYPDHEADVGCIAKVYDDIRDAEIGRANAALIARAPDLAAEVERLRVEHEGPDSWGANAKHLLARCPYTVRQRPGGGPEDIKSSLVVTFMGMQQDLAAERRKVEALREALRFYAQREHFALSDANAWDTVSGEPQNYWCDDAGTATVEDGATARAALASTEGGA